MNNIFGIDLGTTNSMIGLGSELITDMVPSIVRVDTKDVGKHLKEDYKATRSFKTDISLGKEGKESIVASALVLSKLRDIAEEKGFDVKDVVISVPAYFSDNQRQATKEAAKRAGLNVVSLINEPTAAAMAYSKSLKELILVFDLGGGTFDVSVIDSRFGSYDVQATDGIKIGGDDLDLNIMRYIIKKAGIKPHHLTAEKRTMLQVDCEEAKISISKTKSDYIFNLEYLGKFTEDTYPELTINEYKRLVKETFGDCITCAKQVINQSIQYGDKFKILLVGGSTRCPFLQELVEDGLNQKPAEVTYNPDKIVGKGACVYAELLMQGTADVMVSDVTKALSIGLADGTVKTIIPKNSKIPIKDSTMVTNQVEAAGLSLELFQGDSVLQANNESIGRLLYEFDKVKEPNMANVKITVIVKRDGTITLKASEAFRKEVEIELQRN